MPIEVPDAFLAGVRERINAGVLYIDVYTDITPPETQQGGGPDTDYLVGGIWLFVPGDASSVADYAFGAFSDGSDPFRQNNLTALQGTARYEGNAIGVATDTTDEVPVNTIGGDVVLTADFGGAGALGTIGGSITNLYDDEPLTGSLNLGAANIGSSHNGFFIGEVSGSVESLSYTGNWSGQFFGNGETGGMPGSVAGTLSGQSTDGIVNFVGAYGAHRPSSSPMSGGRNILLDALEADAALAEGADIRIRRAARSRRTFGTYQGIGHTTQSSYSFSGQTSDKIAFTFEYDANGDLHHTRTRRLADNTFSFSASTKDAGAHVERFSGSPAAGWKGVEGSSKTDARDAYTAVYSDIRDNADDDYMAFGQWLVGFKNDDGNYRGFRFGTAASGNDPFDANNLAGLTGSATYEGPASGMHMSKASSTAAPVFDYFDANARLTANFGDGTALGSVTGAITGGRTDGGGAVADLTLGSADITNSFSGGNFDGETSGGGYSGKWAAKFFGNGAGSTDHPGSIAGTFGAKTDDELKSILGSFGAYKQ